MTDDLSVLDRLEQEGLAALSDEFPYAKIVKGCEKRYAVILSAAWVGGDPQGGDPQWWEADTLAEVRARIVWALANQ